MTHENFSPGDRVRLVREHFVYAPNLRRTAKAGEVVTLASKRSARAWTVETADGYRAVIDARDIAPAAQPGLFAEVTP